MEEVLKTSYLISYDAAWADEAHTNAEILIKAINHSNAEPGIWLQLS